jgi:hypothetical protein
MYNVNPNGWHKFVRDQFEIGIWAVCLQDFPSTFTAQLEDLGHVVQVIYCLKMDEAGQTVERISNVIILNPNINSFFEVKYIPEVEGSVKEFVCGCLLVTFFCKEKHYTVGSIYDSFCSNAKRRRKNWWIRASIIASEFKNAVFCIGDLNPRSNWWLLNIIGEQSKLLPTQFGIRFLDKLIYNINLLPFAFLGVGKRGTVGELDSSAFIGVIPSPAATMKPFQAGPFYIDTVKKQWIMDGVQTNYDKSAVEIEVLPHDNMSDHAPIKMTLRY